MNYDFSMLDSLLKLKNKNYPIDSNNISFITENYDEDELRILSMRGIQLDRNRIINLFFVENVGFRCFNNKTELYGNLPICRNIENFMNNLYKESFST